MTVTGRRSSAVKSNATAGDRFKVMIVDVETTGLSPSRGAEVVELAFIQLEIDSRASSVVAVHDVYSGLREPGSSIPWAAERVHRISDSMVRGKRLDMHRIREAISSSRYMVAHNASFDRKFIDALPGLNTVVPEWKCSCWGIDWKGDHGLANHKLDSIRDHLGLSSEGAHEAIHDVHVIAKILEHKSYAQELFGLSACSTTSGPTVPWSEHVDGRVELVRRSASGSVIVRCMCGRRVRVDSTSSRTQYCGDCNFRLT